MKFIPYKARKTNTSDTLHLFATAGANVFMKNNKMVEILEQ